jgi:hypothetical protein
MQQCRMTRQIYQHLDKLRATHYEHSLLSELYTSKNVFFKQIRS